MTVRDMHRPPPSGCMSSLHPLARAAQGARTVERLGVGGCPPPPRPALLRGHALVAMALTPALGLVWIPGWSFPLSRRRREGDAPSHCQSVRPISCPCPGRGHTPYQSTPSQALHQTPASPRMLGGRHSLLASLKVPSTSGGPLPALPTPAAHPRPPLPLRPCLFLTAMCPCASPSSVLASQCRRNACPPIQVHPGP